MHVALISEEKIEELTQGTDYTVTDRVVTLAAPTTLKIKIYRQTSTKHLVGWADASVLKAADMNVHSAQLLHLAEETSDLAQDGGLSKDTADNVWDARYNKIKNLLDPEDPGDAVTLNYITKHKDSIVNMLTTTGDNQNARLKATGDAQNARLTSTGDTQNTRLTTTGDTQDKRLNDLGQKYVDLMTGLKDTATTKATEAENSAALAKKWAMSDVSPDGVSGNKSAKTWAEEAKVAENGSASSAIVAASSANASSASATKAKTSETNAATSATAAATSATNAATNATKAKTSETNAATSAAEAAASAENAATFDPTNYAKYNEVLPLTTKGMRGVSSYNIRDVNDIKCLSYPSWFCSTRTVAKEIAHCPTQSAFFLFNLRTGKSSTSEILPDLTSTWYYMVQLIISINGDMWIRSCANNATTTFVFTAWKKTATTYLLPTKTSQLTNDSGYVTEESVDAKIPTKVSQLSNDANYTSKEEVDEIFAHIESGTTEDILLSGATSQTITIETQYPHDTSKPVMLSLRLPPSRPESNSWAGMIPVFDGWIDSTHFKLTAWNNNKVTSHCMFTWMCF